MKIFLFLILLISSIFSRDLKEIKQSNELRHLGVPYANFVTGLGDGLDVELIKGFAKYLGVEYKYIQTNWDSLFGDLIGQNVKYGNNSVQYLDKTEIKGDLIANGLTFLPWREEVVNFSTPTFPSSVWVVAKSNSKLNPIKPANDIKDDIKNVKKLINNHSLLTVPNTCLDARLYDLQKENVDILIHKDSQNLIEMVPTVIDNKVDLTLLDVPDALIALEKWQGEIKILGPVSTEQLMGVAFRKNSLELANEFNKYFEMIKKDGTYTKLVEKYYPSVFYYYSDFFK